MEILYAGLREETLTWIKQQLKREAEFTALPEDAPAVPGSQGVFAKAGLLIIGEEISNPIRLAQEVYSQDRYLSILIINDKIQHQKIKQALLFTPFTGPTFHMVSNEGKQGLATVVEDQLLRTEQRRNYIKLKASVPTLTSPTAHQFERIKQQYVDKVLEEAPIGIILLNQQGIIQSFNHHAAQLLGKSEREVIGMALLALFPQQSQSLLQNLLAGQEPATRKSILVYTHDPEERFVELTLAVLPSRDALPYQIALLSEVTMQVRSRKAVEESAHRVALILESLPQIAWTTDREGKTTYLNSQWYIYTLETPPKGESSGIRFNFQEYLHAEDVAPLLNAWQACFNQGERFEHEYRLRRGSDGRYRWMLGRTVPLRDEAGSITMWVGTSTDIDDVKRVEQQLQSLNQQLAASNEELSAANEEIRATNEEITASNEELSQANWQMQQANATLSRVNADLDTFVYTASHDLKAPILNIEGLLKALQRELGKDRPQVETIDQLYHLLYSSVNRFKATISDLTDVARISKESQEDVSLVSIVQVLEEVTLDLANQIQEAGARLERMLDCPPIQFSRKNLKSILYNLLSNAIKYRSPERVPVVRITCLTQPEYLLLTVEDNGLGMDMRQEEKIFALFKRLHAHVEGTGIGLYIVRKIVENAGGKIEVESQVGKGSTFRVYFRR